MRVLLPVVLAVALFPTVANASTVTVRPNPDAVDELDPSAEPFADELYYAAARGETNDVTVAYAGDAKSITVTDPGAAITPSGTCTAITAHIVTCTARPEASSQFLQDARVELGDGNDHAVSTRPAGPPIGPIRAYGGEGDDVLEGSPIGDFLEGGPGADTMTGGDGVDTLSYADHTTDVSIDLRSSVPHTTAEGDTFSGIENVVGGSGDDTLFGSGDTPTHLSGGPGDDSLSSSFGPGSGNVLEGGSGDDYLQGSDNVDFLRGGKGTDSGNCGGDVDTVFGATKEEVVGRGCERLTYALNGGEDSLTLDPNPRRFTDSKARFKFACPTLEANDGEPSACKAEIVLRDAKGKLGEKVFAGSRDDETFKVSVPLERRRSGSEIQVRITGRKNFPDVGWQFRLGS